jgi:DNA-binding GntR family transcriptional regulator
MVVPEVTATDRVYDALYAAVLEHRLAPGTRLREEELAQRFAVSRTVVRQALQRLAQNRLVELQHNRGAQVTEPTPALAAHVFDARRVVECEVARRLGGRLPAGAQQELAALLQEESQAHQRADRAAAVRLSGQFHRRLAELSGNPVFLHMLDELLPTTSLLMARDPGGRALCVAHRHEELLAALAHSGPAAASEMRRHLSEIEKALTRVAARGHAGSAPRMSAHAAHAHGDTPTAADTACVVRRAVPGPADRGQGSGGSRSS